MGHDNAVHKMPGVGILCGDIGLQPVYPILRDDRRQDGSGTYHALWAMETAIGCYMVSTWSRGSSSKPLLYFIFIIIFILEIESNSWGGRGNMPDLKASGRKGGFQSLRRTLDRPLGASVD